MGGGDAGIDGLKEISERQGSAVVSEQDFGFYSWLLVSLGASWVSFGFPKKHFPQDARLGIVSQLISNHKFLNIKSHLFLKSLKCCIK